MTQESTPNESNRGRWWLEVLRTMRPHQWVKNLFVLAPLFFARQYAEPEALAAGLVAALLFCLTAGTVYLFNDIADRHQDRKHPTKRHRPIASGRLSVSTARYAAWAAGATSLGVAAIVDGWLAAVLGGYLVMNLAYSRVLKEWAFVDVGIIATGFVLRVLAGSVAVGVMLSEWLVLCTFLLACFLGLGKRCHELILRRAGAVDETRRGWSDYRPEQIEAALFFVGGLTVAAYTIYTLTASLPDQPLRTRHTPFNHPLLPVTVPLVVLGLARFYQLVQRQTPASPTETMLRDPVVLATGAVWGLVLVGFLMF